MIGAQDCHGGTVRSGQMFFFKKIAGCDEGWPWYRSGLWKSLPETGIKRQRKKTGREGEGEDLAKLDSALGQGFIINRCLTWEGGRKQEIGGKGTLDCYSLPNLAIYIHQPLLSSAFDHRTWTTGLPVRSAVLKP